MIRTQRTKWEWIYEGVIVAGLFIYIIWLLLWS